MRDDELRDAAILPIGVRKVLQLDALPNSIESVDDLISSHRLRSAGHGSWSVRALMNQTKFEWRRALLSARAAISESARDDRSTAIGDRVRCLPWFDRARSVLGYAAMGAEANLHRLFESCPAVGPGVFLPASSHTDGMPRWVAWNAQRDAAGERFSAETLAYPILAIVPGVGFDLQGMRLGRGGGFYDRALADLRAQGTVHVVGIGFDCQIVPVLPSDPWDQRVDLIISESRAIAVPQQAGSAGEAGARCP